MDCEIVNENTLTCDDANRYTDLMLLLRMCQLCNIEWQTTLFLNNYRVNFEKM
jgi:hypothetical protein